MPILYNRDINMQVILAVIIISYLQEQLVLEHEARSVLWSWPNQKEMMEYLKEYDKQQKNLQRL